MLETLLKIDFLNLCIEKLPKTARNSQNLWWRRKILNHTATQAWALSSKTGSFFLFFTFENGYFPNEILKNKTLCRTFLYRLKSYEAAGSIGQCLHKHNAPFQPKTVSFYSENNVRMDSELQVLSAKQCYEIIPSLKRLLLLWKVLFT